MKLDRTIVLVFMVGVFSLVLGILSYLSIVIEVEEFGAILFYSPFVIIILVVELVFNINLSIGSFFSFLMGVVFWLILGGLIGLIIDFFKAGREIDFKKKVLEGVWAAGGLIISYILLLVSLVIGFVVGTLFFSFLEMFAIIPVIIIGLICFILLNWLVWLFLRRFRIGFGLFVGFFASVLFIFSIYAILGIAALGG